MNENNNHKANAVPDPGLAQIKSESDSWKRSLNFMMDENIHLKGRLMQILKSEVSKDALEIAEDFHNHFIKQDQLNRLLRNDIAELDELLIKGVTNLVEIKRKLIKLRKNVSNASKEFDHLKASFNNHAIAHT